MRILFLTDGIYPFVNGGMQKHSFFLAKGLVQFGHTVTLVHCTYNSDVPSAEKVCEELGLENSKNIEVLGYAFPKAKPLPGHYIRSSKKYARALHDDFGYKISEFDLLYAKGFCALYFKDAGIPVVSNIHGYEMYQQAADAKSKLNAHLLRTVSDKILANSNYLASYGGKITDLLIDLNIAKERIIEIPGGIQKDCIKSEEEIGEPGNSLKFVFVGRFERRKGIEELNQAITEILKNRTDFEFHFVGPIPEEAQVKHTICIYHGQLSGQKAIFEVLDKCDVLVVPSHSEGMPNVILEGLARGLAIIATDVGAVSMMVGSSNGVLLPYCSVENITEGLKEQLQLDRTKIFAMKTESLHKAAQFSWERIAEKNVDAFEQFVRKFKVIDEG